MKTEIEQLANTLMYAPLTTRSSRKSLSKEDQQKRKAKNKAAKKARKLNRR